MAIGDVGELTIGLKFDGKTLQSSMNGVEQKVNSLGDSAGGKTGKSFGGKWAVAAGALIASGVQKIASVVTNGLGSAMSRVDTLNNFPKVMQSLGYSTQEAKSSMDAMDKAVDGLPTSLDAIAGNVQMLTASMGNLHKGTVNATSVGVAFNNMMLAGGMGADAANRAFIQFNQMLAKGKVDMQSWNSVVMTAPGQMDQLAKSMLGASATHMTLYNALQSGKISMQDLEAEMVKLNEEGGANFASFTDQAKIATSGFQTMLKNIKSSFTRMLGAGLMNDMDGMEKAASKLIQRISAYLPQMITTVITSLVMIIGKVPELIASLSEKIIPQVDVMVDGIIKAITSFSNPANQQKMLQSALDLFLKIVDSIPRIIDSLATSLPAIIDSIVTTLTSPTSLSKLLDASLRIWMAVIKAVPQIIIALATAIPKLIDNIVAFISKPENIQMMLVASLKVFMAIVRAIPQILPPLWNALMSLLGAIPRAIFGYCGAVISATANLMTAAVRKVAGFAGSMVNAGRDFIGGLVKGIGNGAVAVVNKVKDICRGALNQVKKFFGIHSPSKVMARMGGFLMSGLGNGIKESANTVISEAKSASAGVLNSFGGGFSTDMSFERRVLGNASSNEYANNSVASSSDVNVVMNNNINNKLDAEEIGQLMMTSIRRAA